MELNDNTTTTKTDLINDIESIIEKTVEIKTTTTTTQIQKLEENFELNLDDNEKDLEKLSEEERKFNDIYKEVFSISEKISNEKSINEKKISIQFQALNKIIDNANLHNEKLNDLETVIKDSIDTVIETIEEKEDIDKKRVEAINRKLENIENETKNKTTKIILASLIFNLITISSIISYFIFFN